MAATFLDHLWDSIKGFLPRDSDSTPSCWEFQVCESVRLLAAHSNLAEPESTSPIFMLKFLIIWSLLEGVKVVIHQSLALLATNSM